MRDAADDQDKRATVEAAGATSFSELLISSDGVDGPEDSVGFVFSAQNGPRMLCFSGDDQNDYKSVVLEPSLLPGVSVSCNNSYYKNPKESCTVVKSTKSSNKKRTRLGNVENLDHDDKSGKKCKRNQDKSSVGIAKVKKERLGEKIAALQQFVSPYGKTDAASVLHEAMCYIKFLQDQIQVLSSPYLINFSLEDDIPVKKVRDLRSRGLCLVPTSSAVHVENSNGADLWLPSMHQGH